MDELPDQDGERDLDGGGGDLAQILADPALARLCPDLVRFCAAAATEHVTAAAQELGVPQSTLSRSLARTQDALGLDLFARSGRGLRLTRHGRRFLARAERALAELAEGSREARDEARGPGSVSLGFHPAMGTGPVPALISGFRKERPGVRFRLHQGSSEELVELLLGREIDVGLMAPTASTFSEESAGELAVEPLGDEPLLLVVPRGHRLARRRRVGLAEAATEEFVGLVPYLGLRRTVDGLCRAAGFTPRIAFEGAEITTVRALVAAGLGIAVLPPAPRRAPTSGVAEIPLTDPGATRRLSLVHLRTRAETPAVAAFRTHVHRRAARVVGGG